MKMVLQMFLISMVLFGGSEASRANDDGGGPYDIRYRLRNTVNLYQGPEKGAAIIAQIGRKSGEITLRWCRPEFPFRKWIYGGKAVRRQLLNQRICEVRIDDRIGFIEGKALDLY